MKNCKEIFLFCNYLQQKLFIYIYYGGELPEVIKYADKSKNTSIFGDLNKNGVVDADDFVNDNTKSILERRGLSCSLALNGSTVKAQRFERSPSARSHSNQ